MVLDNADATATAVVNASDTRELEGPSFYRTVSERGTNACAHTMTTTHFPDGP